MFDMSTHEPPPSDTLSAYLSSDHERQAFLLDEAARAVGEGRFAEAQSAFSRFEAALDHHLRLEEEVVFPVFEVRSGITTGPTIALRCEHRDIRNTVRSMEAALSAEDARTFRESVRFLDSIVTTHEAKEEHVLYPAIDRLLTSAERALLLERLRRE